MNSLFFVTNRGMDTLARPCSDYIDTRIVSATTGVVHAIPTDASFVIFKADGDFYARPNTIAAIPTTGAVTAGTGSELNPTSWALNGQTGIGLIASSSRIITLSFYKA